MLTIQTLLERLHAGAYDDRLRRIYCCAAQQETEAQRARIAHVVDGFRETFGKDETAEVEIFSAPGRTELGGNHTDHQRGRVLAASINLDILACAAPNGTNEVRVRSEGFETVRIDLTALAPVESEKNTSASLIRGVAARLTALGHKMGGFDAYMTSNVLAGSGLSSSAAYEVMLGVIMNRLFCGEAHNPVEIAQIGQYAENVYFGKPSGLLDQMAASVGNVVAIDFADPEKPVIRRVDFDFASSGYALCIIDSGADHADLTDEYASIPTDMRAVAACMGAEVLREVDEQEFYKAIPRVRRAAGDRAVLRATHFFVDDRRAAEEADALAAGDFDRFCELVRASGASSFMYLQNVFCPGTPREQAVAVALSVAERALGGSGAFRVHGGGFAGTIQAFVPLHLLEEFRETMEQAIGEGCCHVLSIRPEGGTVLIAE